MGAAVLFPAGGGGRAGTGGGHGLVFARAALDSAEETEPRYLLKDLGGHVALYSGDGQGPLAEYDLMTRLLPEQDVLALQQGVPVKDEAELQRRLEDYGL